VLAAKSRALRVLICCFGLIVLVLVVALFLGL